MNPTRTPVYAFVRSVQKNIPLSNPIGGAVFFSNTDQTANGFQLTDCPNSSEFTNLFDQYRIVKVEMTWTPSVTTAVTGSTADMQLPNINTVADFDDGVVPTNNSNLLQYQSYKSQRLDRAVSRIVSPRAALAVYNNAAIQGYAYADGPLWCNTSNPSIQHYGIKWALVWPAAGTATQQGNLILSMRYFLEFRCVN